MERATALFLDCSGEADAFLAAHAREIETVIGREASHATATLAWTSLEIAAVTDTDGQACALLTIARPAHDADDASLDPLLDAAIDASPAIIWLKDLDGRYLRVNRQYVEQLGTSADRVCGRADAELEAGESIERVRLERGGKPAKEPLELEYMVDAADGLPAFAVLRFALRDVHGKPSAVCGLAAALGQAEVARSECRKLMWLDRWRRSDESTIRAELIGEWGLMPVSRSDVVASERPLPRRETIEADGDQFAALAAELDAALETSARLGEELAEERRQVMVLREASVLSARRGQELLRSVTAERARSAELEESLARAEARASELDRERDIERSSADRAEAAAADALAHEHEIAETLRAELAASRDELERSQAAARDAPTLGQLEAARAEAHKAKLTAEQAQAEMATTNAALVKEQRTVEMLRGELRAAEQEIERVRRAASEAAAQALTEDELEQERWRAERANAALASVRARAEMAEAESKSALAQARADLRRFRDEAAAASDALTAEKQQAASLRRELTELSDELEATQRELSERPTAEELEQERLRTEQERSRAEQDRQRADQAEAAGEQARREASALAETIGVLERAAEAESSGVVTAEQQTVERLRGELAVREGELERVRRELAERPTSEELEQARSHADRERSSAEQQLARADQAEAAREQAQREAAAHAERIAALQDAQEQATESSSMLAAERQTAELLRRELTTVREQLERTKQAVLSSEGQASASSEEFERAQTAETALQEQRIIAEEAAASAEQATIKAAAASAAAEAERETVESLRAELSAAQAELERGETEAVANETDASHRNGNASLIDPVTPGSPVWQPASQRALSAALTAVEDWRTALQQTVKVVGCEGRWDAVVAWSPDKRRKHMRCVAMWTAEATTSSTFETRVWQHRQKLPVNGGSPQHPPTRAISFVDLQTAEDPLLKAAADEGIGSAVLVPITDGPQLIGTLQLMSRHTTSPTAELMLSLEGVALQLVAISRLLDLGSTPHWRVGTR
jgi:PAS domain S-box-containing protein